MGTVVLFIALLVLATVIPGTILGWVAAKRIHHSDGSLYGLRVAAVAALPLPSLVLVGLLVSACLLTLRINSFGFQIPEEAELFLLTAIFSTGALLLIKWIQSMWRSVMLNAPLISGFLSSLNRLTLIAIALIWVVFGALFAASMAGREKPQGPSSATRSNAAIGPSFGEVITHRLRLAKVDGPVRYLDLESGEVRTADRENSLRLRSRVDPAEPIDLQTAEKIHAMEPPQGAKLIALETDPKVQALIFGATILPEGALEELLPPPANRFDQFTPQRLIDSKLEVAGLDASERSHYRAFEKFPTAGDDLTTLTIPFETELGRIGVVEITSVDGDSDHVQLRLKYLISK